MDIQVLGIDLGKNSCSIVGLDAAGSVVMRRRMRRQGIAGLAAKMPGCVVAMEACCGAHHLGRLLAAQGHKVRLMSPEYVRPYVKAQKNDDRDAEAIAEAATRPTMRFVALKTEAQLDVQVLHRARDRLVGQRTALTNQIRSTSLCRKVDAGCSKRWRRCRLGQTVPAWDLGCGLTTCSISGAPSTGGSWLWMTSSPTWRATTRRRAGWRPSRASAC